MVKSARNIPGVLTTTARILSVYDLVNAKYLVIDHVAVGAGLGGEHDAAVGPLGGPGAALTGARILSVYDLVNAKYLVIDQAALATIEEVYA